MGPGHKVAGCRILGDPCGYCWFTSGQRHGPEDAGAVAHHWHVQLDPGVNARLQSGRAGS